MLAHHPLQSLAASRRLAFALAVAVAIALSSRAASAQMHYYYCDSPGREAIALSEVGGPALLTTRNQSEAAYRAGSACEFRATAEPGSLLMVDLLDRSLGAGAALSVGSGSRQLLSYAGGGSADISAHLVAMVTHAGVLRLQLDVAAGATDLGPGIRARVRAFRVCPPGWASLESACYGAAPSADRLSFADAQAACNAMRANLLAPPGHTPELETLRAKLAGHRDLAGGGAALAWVGLTDATAWGRLSYYWLDGRRYTSYSKIGCTSGGSYRLCYSSERCALLNWNGGSGGPSYSVYMTACSTRQAYLCAMPVGGTDWFQPVPPGAGTGATGDADGLGAAWLWAAVLAALLVTGLLGACAWAAVRYWSGAKPQRVAPPRPLPPLTMPFGGAAAAASVQVPPPPPYTIRPMGEFDAPPPAPPPPPYTPRDLTSVA